MKSEQQRRQSNTEKVFAALHAQPGAWITARELALVGGFCAWRTRISQARVLAEKDGQIIEWNGNIKASAYRLVPKPLGRHAEEQIERTLFPL